MKKILQKTNGKSLSANIALAENNITVGVKIARQLYKHDNLSPNAFWNKVWSFISYTIYYGQYKKLMLQNQLLSQALIFFFMFFLTTFLFSLILKLILPFLIAFLLTKLFYKWIVEEKSHTEMVSFFSSIRKNNGFF